jgi:magnesium chelatase family protein
MIERAITRRVRVGEPVRQLHLWARGYYHVLRLARTIADLAGADGIGLTHLVEAIQYRPRRME